MSLQTYALLQFSIGSEPLSTISLSCLIALSLVFSPYTPCLIPFTLAYSLFLYVTHVPLAIFLAQLFPRLDTFLV